MADPVTSIGGFVPNRVGAPAGLTPRPSTGLAPRPSTGLRPIGTPFAAKAQQQTDKQTAIDKALANPNLPAWARDAIANPDHRRSIGAQIGGTFAGIPAGVAHFAKDVGTDLSNLVPGALQVIHHHGMTGGAAPELGARHAVVAGGGPDPGPSVNSAHMFPTATGMGKSFEQTAGRIAQLGPVEVRSVGGEPITTYGDAYRQGNIVPTLLGDAMNVSMAAGAVAPVLGGAGWIAEGLGAERLASGLGTAADVSRVVSRVGGRAGNAPIEAVGGVLKGGKSLWREAGQAGKEALVKIMPQEGPFSMAMHATEEGKLSKATAKAAMNEPAAASRWMETNLAKDSGLLRKNTRPSMAEQEVGLTRAGGVAQAHSMVADRVGPEAAMARIPREEVGRTVTREGAALNKAYEAGTLPADQMARIDAVTAAYKKQAGLVTENALAGTGLIKGPMDPAYTGDAPIPHQLDLQLEQAGVHPQQIASMHEALAAGASLDDLTHVIPELHDVLLNPDIYPKPWREPMQVMAHGHAMGATDLPRTPAEMLAAGMERPTYMPSTESGLGLPSKPQTAAITTGIDSGLRGVANENHAKSTGFGPYSLATAAEALGRNVRTTKFNSIIQDYVANNKLPSAADVLARPGPDGLVADLGELQARAEAAATARETSSVTPENHATAVAKEFGQLVNDQLQQRGYEVLPGNRADPQIKDFNPKNAEDLTKITGDSIALPKGVKDQMIRYHTGAKTNRVLELNKVTNSFFKRNVLAFNMHWTAGDALSNQLMGWVAGGVDPISMGKGMIDVGKMDPAQFEQIFNRPNFTKTGLRQQAAEAFNAQDGVPVGGRGPTKLGSFVADHGGIPGRALGKLGEGIRGFQNKAFKVNAAVNGIQREGWSIVKLERELKARGLSSIDELGTNEAKWKAPDVQKAVNDVINESNKVFGVMDEMSPFEQRVMTQIFPFWAWTRHITTLAARTAIDNPARVLWTLRLGALGMNTTPQDMPSYLGGSFGWGAKQRINTNWANPLYDVGTGGLIGPGGAARSLSPLIKFGLTAGTNRDASRNLNTVTHAAGSHPNQIGSAIYQGLTSTPFIRGAINLAPTAHVPGTSLTLGPIKRYGSGEPILDKQTKTPLSAGSRAHMAGQVVNMPMPTTYVPTKATGKARSTSTRKKGLKGSGLGSGLKHVGLRG